MILLTADKISKSYSRRKLLDEVSFGVSEGDKIGVIGVNGTGKSTLLKLVAGLEEPDSGRVTKGVGVRVGYLPQNPDFEGDLSALEQVMRGVSTHKRENQEFECRSILNRLGLTNVDQPVGQLSGGQKRRVAMACALASEAEVLILDEPTNHIDNETVEWLENALARYRGALLMVTHDRYFLDRVTNRILELDGGTLYSHQGGYSAYLEGREQREEMAQASERKRRSLLRQELEWIQRGARARSTKARFRVERYEELSGRQGIQEEAKLTITASASRLGRKIIEARDLRKAYGGRELLGGFSYHLLRDDRLGILGSNGCGKSTLLRLLGGLLEPDGGAVEMGDTVRIGYFSQESEAMDISLRAIDYIKEAALNVETPDGMLTAAQMMEKFLFDGDLQYTPINRLSGGERRRLFLLRVLIGAPNVLLLDEPTNDLDIETLTILEDYLAGFPGAVIAVSHDRYFLDKVVDHLFAFEADGQIRPYLGGYSDYREAVRGERREEKPASKKEKPADRPRTGKLKFTYSEQREYEAIDGEIASLEERQTQVGAELAASASDYVRLEELMSEKAALETELAGKMERWVALNELAEKIGGQD